MAIKNINYDLIKLLSSKMDNIWRLEKFYCDDAKKVGCKSVSTLEKILEDEKHHLEMLKKEIKTRLDAGVFD